MVDTLVVVFAMSVEAAWRCTPHDFWRLIGFRMEMNRGKHVRIRPMSKREMEQLIALDEVRQAQAALGAAPPVPATAPSGETPHG
jgi:hypothetical protein